MVGISLAERQDRHGNLGETAGGSKDCPTFTLYVVARPVMEFYI